MTYNGYSIQWNILYIQSSTGAVLVNSLHSNFVPEGSFNLWVMKLELELIDIKFVELL